MLTEKIDSKDEINARLTADNRYYLHFFKLLRSKIISTLTKINISKTILRPRKLR